MQDLPENHFRVSGASWVNIINYYYYSDIKVIEMKFCKLASSTCQNSLDVLFDRGKTNNTLIDCSWLFKNGIIVRHATSDCVTSC